MNTEETRTIVRNWFADLIAGNGDAVFARLADTCVLTLPDREAGVEIAWHGEWKGKDEIARAFAIRAEYLDVVDFMHKDLLVDGNRGMAINVERNRIKATGREYSVEIVQLVEVNEEGEISSIRAYYDPYPIAESLKS